MSVSFIIAQILGLTSAAILCISYLVKDKKKFLLIGFLGDVVYGLTFIFVDSLGAGLITLLSCVQFLVFYAFEKKGKKMPKSIAFLFVLSFVGAGALDFANAWDLIPIITYAWYTVALYKEDVKKIRFMYLLANALLVVYDIMVMAYANAVEDGLETICLIVVIALEFSKKRNTAKDTEINYATLTKISRRFGKIKGVNDFQSFSKQVETSDNHDITPKPCSAFKLCPIDRYG